MNYEYTCKKKTYDLKNYNRAQILFLNGDFIEIYGKEIVELQVVLYDQLVHYYKHYLPVAKSGFIKLKISTIKPLHPRSSVYNEKELLTYRKPYIQKRCVEEGGIFAIRLFNEDDWSDIILGNISARLEDKFIILTFSECLSLGSSDGENHVINLKNVYKRDVRVVNLDFENCDGIDVYQDEIEEINLTYKKELEWVSDGYTRVVQGGYIRLKFNKDYHCGRNATVYCEDNPKFKDIEKRICGKGEDTVDICHLYISNYHCGYGLEKKESILVTDLPLPTNQHEDYGNYPPYISGYAERQKDGSIMIYFGKIKQ